MGAMYINIWANFSGQGRRSIVSDVGVGGGGGGGGCKRRDISKFSARFARKL